MSAPLLRGPREGYGPGHTVITTTEDPSGVALSSFRLGPGEWTSLTVARETAWLLLSGELKLQVAGHEATFVRRSVFDDAPSAIHVSAGASVWLKALDAVELLQCETANATPFSAALYPAEKVKDEHRGKGRVHDAAYRFVRTVFDGSNAPKEAQLVLGEVVNFPGRWSSYPPHHHPQPELYHYRFSDPRGYGHAEVGEDVLKVRHCDTLRILKGVDHPQCAAPGYAMYYAWVIRHLPGAPYVGPEFNPEHTWTMDEGASAWWPKGVP
jgi:5-deoxy-glucuronate isomerase